MRLLTLPPLLALLSLSSAYKIWIWQDSTSCAGEPDNFYNVESDGDCQISEGGGYSIKFDSDAGCYLSTWTDMCASMGVGTEIQNECFAPGYQMFGYSCKTD